MWELTAPWWEVVIRSTVLSLFPLLLIRLSHPGGGDFDRLLEGSPRILIHNGKINEETCKSERLSKQDVMRAVRNGGCISIASVHVAFVETNGKISIIAKQNRQDK